MSTPKFMMFYFVIASSLYQDMFQTLDLDKMDEVDAEAWRAILHVFRMGEQLKARNCDLYREPLEMQQAFQRFCHGVDECKKCPVHNAWYYGCCQFAWSQLPATNETWKDLCGRRNDPANPL